MIAPEDMQIGQLYIFDYISHTGVFCEEIGRFIKAEIDKEYGPGKYIYWFWFTFKDKKGTNFDAPTDYASVNNIRLVVED